MSENIQYFSKGIWVSATKFHSPDVETDLNRIECIYSSLKTGSAASAFITFLLSLSGIMFFNFALISMSFLWIIPLMVSFFWLRSTLYNYVELYVEIAGQKKKVMVCPTGRRQMVYEIEDFVKERFDTEIHKPLL